MGIGQYSVAVEYVVVWCGGQTPSTIYPGAHCSLLFSSGPEAFTLLLLCFGSTGFDSMLLCPTVLGKDGVLGRHMHARLDGRISRTLISFLHPLPDIGYVLSGMLEIPPGYFITRFPSALMDSWVWLAAAQSPEYLDVW